MDQKTLIYLGRSDSRSSDGSYLHLYKCYCQKVFKALPRSIRIGKQVSCGCYRAYASRLRVKGRAPANKRPDIERAAYSAFSNVKGSAKSRNLVFTLSVKDIRETVFKDCHYCGRPPATFIKNSKDSARNTIPVNGIDRYDNDIGYVIENCVPCCPECNYLKSNRHGDEFKALIKRIFNHVIASI